MFIIFCFRSHKGSSTPPLGAHSREFIFVHIFTGENVGKLFKKRTFPFVLPHSKRYMKKKSFRVFKSRYSIRYSCSLPALYIVVYCYLSTLRSSLLFCLRVIHWLNKVMRNDSRHLTSHPLDTMNNSPTRTSSLLWKQRRSNGLLLYFYKFTTFFFRIFNILLI